VIRNVQISFSLSETTNPRSTNQEPLCIHIITHEIEQQERVQDKELGNEKVRATGRQVRQRHGRQQKKKKGNFLQLIQLFLVG
jgi:hypothetical protein